MYILVSFRKGIDYSNRTGHPAGHCYNHYPGILHAANPIEWDTNSTLI